VRHLDGQFMKTVELSNARVELAECGREFYRRGWVLGTSGNFSTVVQREPMRVSITASGLEKGKLDGASFLELDEEARVLNGSGLPSAETSLHLAIYRALVDAGAVLHTHSVWGTILSDMFFDQGAIEIQGYEMLKGLEGVETHEYRERVPIIANSQDYFSLSQKITTLLSVDKNIHGFYLHRHGFYTWGKTLADARRHIEIFEFLFEVVGRQARR
jgi:methylthioribulose-1-phosphate dehydratase